jgi:hypothetical protein
MVRALGPAHPDTLTTRNNIAARGSRAPEPEARPWRRGCIAPLARPLMALYTVNACQDLDHCGLRQIIANAASRPSLPGRWRCHRAKTLSRCQSRYLRAGVCAPAGSSSA